MKRVLAATGVVLGLGLIGYAVFSRETDEEQIRRRLTELADAVHLDAERGNPAVRGLELRGRFAELFEKDVRAQIPELGSSRQTRDDLAALAAQSSAYFQSLDLDFQKVDVQLDGTRSGARVSSVVVMTATRRTDPAPERDEREVTFRFVKTDDPGWRIAELVVGERPAP